MENYDAGGGVEKLNSDVTLDIFNQLPRKVVLQTRKVCKTWNSLIGKPKIGLLSAIYSNMLTSNMIMDSKFRLYFGEKYNEEFIDDEEQCTYEALTNIDLSVIINQSYSDRLILKPYMVGSCNGLVCFNVYHHDIRDPVFIYNPLTGEHTHLPEIVRKRPWGIARNIVFGGFGYCQSTDEYKVIGIYYDEDYQIVGSSERVANVQVYTLGGGCGWRNIQGIAYDFKDSGVFAYDAVYWLDRRERCSVVAFDLEEEKFQIIPSPPLNDEFPTVGLQLLGGNFCLYHTYARKFLDIWTLNKGKSCWIKEFSTNLENWNADWLFCKPLALTNRNELLLHYNENLSQYDMKTSTLKKIWEDDSKQTNIQAIPHMHSLVSLEALGETLCTECC